MCILGMGSCQIWNLPKFSLISERSMAEVPTIAIAFPDGSTDTLVLDKYFSNEDDHKAGVNRCNFIGHLAEETDACVKSANKLKSTIILLPNLFSRSLEA